MLRAALRAPSWFCRLTVDTPSGMLRYAKTLPLSPGLGLSLHAECNYEALWNTDKVLMPRAGFLVQMGGGNNVTMARNSFDVKHKAYVTRNLGVELCGNVSIPLPVSDASVRLSENRRDPRTALPAPAER